ncbi:MAG: sensor domain-containing diguanylate cyclase [Bdellovibrionales bacterium]|nr:sensor domain-containing diguanylate cyclase [Bdellovibrionales bacterium]
MSHSANDNKQPSAALTLEPALESAEAVEVVVETTSAQAAPPAAPVPGPVRTQAVQNAGPKLSELAAYTDLFDRLLDATFIVDPETYLIRELNPSSERIFGVDFHEFVGRNVVDLVEKPFRDEFIKALRVSMRRYHPRQFEAQWLVMDNENPGACKMVIVEIVACPLKLSDGREVLQVIARDITARREAENKVQALLKDLKVANEKLEIMATVDEMTKLHNFRYFKTMIAQEHERAERFKTPYSIVFCDIDNFKHYNDRNGHPAGDALLKEMAGVIQECARNTDLCARYGGEEFVMLCPQITWEQAVVLAERVKAKVTAHPFPHAEAQPLKCISFSIGVASYPANGATWNEVVHHADQAMYWSKTHGRNQVTTFEKFKELAKNDPKFAAEIEAHSKKKAA